jgi:mono/diheme cytochrome c family protein
MPALPTLSDDDIADVLTYVRREWENTADPVTVETVRRARAETAGREKPWSAEELSKVR